MAALTHITLEQAQEYFDAHLHAEAWGSSTSNQERALKQAEREITRLPLSRPHSSALRDAICEQALWLLEQTSEDMGRRKAIEGGVTSRSIGDTSESYRESSIRRDAHEIAPKAMAILKPYKMRRTGGLRA